MELQSLRSITVYLLALTFFSCGVTSALGAIGDETSYVVIFDAGSSGSRVHVYKFGANLELVPLGNDIEYYKSITPGLSSYASDPKAAALSLKPLLEDALKEVPENVRIKTLVRLGATAGLRLLPGDKAERILEEVERFLKDESGLLLLPNSVLVIDGKDEGAYIWVCVNYLTGNIGKPFDKTIGAVDLGGGSVQMVYAISEQRATKAPEGDAYLKTLYVGGQTYHLYVHSYLNYGQLAARAQILKLTNGSVNPCVVKGYAGVYKYGDAVYTAISPKKGASFAKCRELTFEMLKLSKSCPYNGCTFDGIWSGEGGAGQRELYVASFFYDRASALGILKNSSSNGDYVKPSDFGRTARKMCSMSYEETKKIPGLFEDAYPMQCMDMVYQYTLLVEGFGINPNHKVKVVKRIPYQGFNVESSWTLGSAIEAASSLPTTHSLL